MASKSGATDYLIRDAIDECSSKSIDYTIAIRTLVVHALRISSSDDIKIRLCRRDSIARPSFSINILTEGLDSKYKNHMDSVLNSKSYIADDPYLYAVGVLTETGDSNRSRETSQIITENYKMMVSPYEKNESESIVSYTLHSKGDYIIPENYKTEYIVKISDNTNIVDISSSIKDYYKDTENISYELFDSSESEVLESF